MIDFNNIQSISRKYTNFFRHPQIKNTVEAASAARKVVEALASEIILKFGNSEAKASSTTFLGG